ncbi:testis-expressed protein 26 isoform X2 [Amia ocellicauda]|uniref:testis-expressed protein 26 isoform X2 n=1 Tax=Amia ocellicauda TaxID=2972642 RepID=UPI003463BFB4
MEELRTTRRVPMATQLSGDMLRAQLEEQPDPDPDGHRCASVAHPEEPNTHTAQGGKHNWDPYETSNNRDFIYRPNSATQAVRPTTSKAYRVSYELGDPVGASFYSQEFCWKPFSKPDHIRSGTSSGNRRNNPHPSQSFMVWQLPKQEKQISTDSRSPWKKPPSEEEIRKALTAQYRSTYKTDYLGIPQGFQVKHVIPAPLNWKRDIPRCSLTETRHHYQPPKHNPDLRSSTSRYGSNTQHRVPAKGVVPSVTYEHIKIQENGKQLTTYDRHFGGQKEDISTVLNSLQPQELHHFLQNVPEKDKVLLQRFLRSVTFGSQTKHTTDPLSPSKPDRMSGWPGPL